MFQFLVAASCFITLVIKESNNNVELIVLYRLDTLLFSWVEWGSVLRDQAIIRPYHHDGWLCGGRVLRQGAVISVQECLEGVYLRG